MAYDIFARFYDSLTENVGYKKRADYFCRLLSSCNEQKGILLDLACGTGTLSIEFAKRGYDVIGVDCSVGMLSEARRKCAKAGQNILLLCQNAAELDLYGTIDFAVCALDSINHFSGADEVQTAFDKVSLFMNKGGAFVFDVNTIYKHKNILADNSYIYDYDDVFCAWQNTLNDDMSVDISLDFFSPAQNGLWERSTEEFTERAYPLEELEKMLVKSGFSVSEIYDDLTLDPVGPDSERAVFLARKE
ncbi:MAG: methyltransferase domain-containing protein [Clostridia bacterium]|nr:methyltransferase domain-containing protein [Clostridia bacterium]